MIKYFKRILFWLFILLLVIIMGVLAAKGYVEANCSRAIKYISEKYKVEEKDLTGVDYQEYVYSDITNCDSLWLKKCTDDQELVYIYELEVKDGTKITVKELSDGSMEDDYEKGTLRKSYIEKMNKLNKNNQNNENKENNKEEVKEENK